jgi:hypothetical protein
MKPSEAFAGAADRWRQVFQWSAQSEAISYQHAYESAAKLVAEYEKQAEADRALLVEMAEDSPWRDDRGVNRCGYCWTAWEHKADDSACLWVRVREHLGLKGGG